MAESLDQILMNQKRLRIDTEELEMPLWFATETKTVASRFCPKLPLVNFSD